MITENLLYLVYQENKKNIFQDKGQLNELKAFGDFIKNKDKNDIGPIPLWQLNQATVISFEVERQIRNL